jgi:hypothetical protein
MTKVISNTANTSEVFVPHNAKEQENHDALCVYFSEMCYW